MVKSKVSLDTIFSSLADPTRRMILYQLALGKKLTAGEIAHPHSISVPAISRHLKILEKAHLIKRAHEGKKHFFTLGHDSFKSIADYLTSYQT